MAGDSLGVDLDDGRTVSVPLAWHLRLLEGTAQERENRRLIGWGEGIHWSDLDEYISVEGLLAGRRSGESQSSLKRWLSECGARVDPFICPGCRDSPGGPTAHLLGVRMREVFGSPESGAVSRRAWADSLIPD